MTWQLQIHQTLGRIGLSYTPGQLSIRTRRADMEIHRTNPDVQIHRTPSQLTIDQSDAFAQEGREKPLQFTERLAEEAKQTVLNGISETAQIGDSIARAKTANHAFDLRSMRYAYKVPETVPALVPAPFSVHIHYELSRIEFHTDLGKLEHQVHVQPPDISYQVGKIRTYLDPPPQLTIIPPSDHNYVV